ncbi:cytochrome c oxidase subunit 3 family protein [Persicimonas caeni]|uniref:Cytochrome c oxidase subunit 3 family protein n=1 Tax=Persicimonas caeni TaxID=2292766 RepID=A0A4Y6PQ47_PERCE|nr:cytochrome c oxidase subunit 3 family protein [Persicimonas caeni]QDG50444.1 cytochrome c oxidase subunit 3 family protein [Persicimonas caeni]QED31665.1 cytochrome c oxidase subunit 3 family protein [Persicimonas caeni]
MSESTRDTPAHQFESLDQQHHAATLGMWIFLSSEIMLFGGMFVGYTVYRILYGETFQKVGAELNLLLGSVNTVILITSSFTIAVAVHAAKDARQKLTRLMLAATASLGSVFLLIKGYEWYEELHKNLVPFEGMPFAFSGADVGAAKIFMSFYFAMTGFHFLHLLIGVGLVSWMLLLSFRGKISKKKPNNLEMTGLYWHLVDVIWVFIYPLFYLVGP